MTEQKDPRVDWGFYAMTPRIVRTKYPDLSHTEKWLYTCLRDLCGKKGTCFRTLRSLKEETDISIASLSTMIPRLHAAGLIHAEKKRRSASGKEIWHISIVDIWQMNKEYCSEIEQSQKEVVQDLNEETEVVQSVNKVVQNPNKATGDCSNPERDCSNFSDIRRYPKNKGTEIYSEEEGYVATASADRPPAPSSQDLPYQPDFTAHEQPIHIATSTPTTPYQSDGQDGYTCYDTSEGEPNGSVYNNLDLHRAPAVPDPVHSNHDHEHHPSPADQAPVYRVSSTELPSATGQGAAHSQSHEVGGVARDNHSQIDGGGHAGPGNRRLADTPAKAAQTTPAAAVAAASQPPEPAQVEGARGYMTDTPLVTEEAGKKATGKRASKVKPPVFTADGQRLYDAWCLIFKSPPGAAEKTIVCANELAPRIIPWCKDLKVSCKDMLDEIRKWEYATDPEYYRKRGVTLCDIGRDFERWQSVKTEEQERAQRSVGKLPGSNPQLELLRAQAKYYAQMGVAQ